MALSTPRDDAVGIGRIDVAGRWAGAVYFVVLAGLSVARMRNHWAGGLDLGLFDQAVWRLSRGESPDVTFVDGSIFGDHVSPVLVLLAPLYRIASTPVWLLLAQAGALGATIVPMRRVADLVGASRWLATVATVGSAPLLAAAMFDFHPAVLAVPGGAWLLVGALADHGRTAFVALTWITFCRADAAFIAVGIAVLARNRLRLQLVLLGLVGAGVGLVAPQFFGEPRQTFDRYYADLGDSPLDALTHPWRLVSAVTDPSFFDTLVIWLVPVLFLPVLRPRWFVVLLVGGSPLLLSSWPGVALPWFHNAALMAPVAIAGALAAVAGVAPSGKRAAQIALLSGAALALAFQSPVSPRAPIAVRLPDVLRPNGARVNDTLALVPDRASVAAPNQLAAPLAQRREIYSLPCPFPELVDEDDDEGLLDICDDRRSRPDVVLAEERRADALASLGYTVRETPTPGIVIGFRDP